MEENVQEQVEETFELYELKESEEKRHLLLRAPKSLPAAYCTKNVIPSTDIFNILMGDVSGSMCTAWRHVVEGWQDYIKDRLTGRTEIFVFGSSVRFVRTGTELRNEDNSGGGTDLTAALKTVREEVNSCTETHVRVFIVTDGAHGHGDPYPDTEIERMITPNGKTVSVYLLGIGSGFPVNYSMDIRSKLHNGNANIPSLFWAKSNDDIVNEMAAIGDVLNSALVKLKLNVEGYILPGLDKTPSLHLGEWLYFEDSPENMPSLSISVNEDDFQPVESTLKPAKMRDLLDYVFRQWNSVMIQQHRNKAPVPRETFNLMDSLFNYFMETLKKDLPEGNNIKARLAKKNLKSYDVEYRTLVNRSKTVIDIEGKYLNEMELAETILKTTVTNRKYDVKNLKLKGHGQDEYEKDMEAFKQLYKKAKAGIMALPPPSSDECCNVTISSTLTDLQDPNFHEMFEESKFDLLKSFTMSGIPIHAPVRDASQINPWTLIIKQILVTPFTILSQQVLEESAAANILAMGIEDKDVILQQDNEKTRFNAIIPIVPANAAKILKPLVLSNIYAMMTTFCILKNPHIIDYNVHLAALGCAWIRTVKEYPVKNRPEFASKRVESMVATANLYMGRPSVTRYVDALIGSPKQALMTESVLEFEEKTLKCESLIKPTFFIYLKKDKFSMQQVSSLLKLMLFEFIGRCLSTYKADDSEASPFTDFFCKQLTDRETKEAWLGKHFKAVIDKYQANQGNLLEKFFTLEELYPGIKKFVADEVADLADKLLDELTIATDMSQVKKLSNFGACGDINWTSFRMWAEEMDVPQEMIEELFSPAQAMVYISVALQIKSSKERLASDLPSPDSALKVIQKKILAENARTLRSNILKEVMSYTEKQWREAYMKAHNAVAMPLRPEEVINAAQARDIKVTLNTFNKVYRRYNERLGLLRNACQMPACPHYLQPHNNFNQHLAVEREGGEFPHSLHLVSHEFCSKGTSNVIEEVVSGKHAGTRNRKRPSPPSPTSFQHLSDQIETLLKFYADGNQKG